MYAFELATSAPLADDGSLTREFAILGVQDEVQARDLAYAAASVDYNNKRFKRSGAPSLEKLGYDSWKATFKYVAGEVDEVTGGGSDPGANDPPQGIVEFDTSGGTQHITTGLTEVRAPGSTAPDRHHAIGVTVNNGEVTVEGCDIVIPKLTLTITKHFRLNQITGTYIKNVARLTGKTNQPEYQISGEEFDVGELLFLGASGSSRGRSDWEITFRFEASQNNMALEVAPNIPKVPKFGHDYLWVTFKSAKDKDRIVQHPEFAYVTKVYDSADFKSVLGF